MEDVTEEGLGLDHLLLDIPARLGVAGDEVHEPTGPSLDRHGIHHPGMTDEARPVEQSIDEPIKAFVRDEPRGEQSIRKARRHVALAR